MYARVRMYVYVRRRILRVQSTCKGTSHRMLTRARYAIRKTLTLLRRDNTPRSSHLLSLFTAHLVVRCAPLIFFFLQSNRLSKQSKLLADFAV